MKESGQHEADERAPFQAGVLSQHCKILCVCLFLCLCFVHLYACVCVLPSCTPVQRHPQQCCAAGGVSGEPALCDQQQPGQDLG